MATSNSVYLTVRETPPLENTGWEIRILSYKDYVTPVAITNSYLSLDFSDELNDIGGGSIEFSLTDPFWKQDLWTGGTTALDLLEGEYLFQCWEDGVHRFDFLGERVKLKLVSADNDPSVVISGPGTAAFMQWGIILPPGFPYYKAGVHWSKTDPAMQYFYKLLKAAQGRDTIPWVSPTFSLTKDSTGADWADLKSVIPVEDIEYGADLLDTLNTVTGQDDTEHHNIRADWHMAPGCQLDVRQDGGVHLESKVIFWDSDIFEKNRDRERENIRNYVVVSDSMGHYSLKHDSASKARWNRREYLDTKHQQLVDTGRRKKAAEIILAMKKLEDSEWTIQVPYDRYTRRPYRDYGVGDWIGIARYTEGAESKVDPYRVLAIAIRVTKDDTTVELTLQSLLDLRQKKLERAMDKLLHTNPLGGIKLPDDPYKVPDTPPMPVIWDPSNGFQVGDEWPGTSSTGNRVFISAVDPATDSTNDVQTGDFWLDLSISDVI